METRVLIVVRDRETRELLAETFAGRGFRALTTSDGISGLYQVGLVQPDLVVLDIKGWETLRRMRARSSVPIIVLIEDELGDRIESLNQGADYFVTKPPSLREVEAKARALLRRRTPMQPPMRVQSSTEEEVTGPRQAGVCEIGP